MFCNCPDRAHESVDAGVKSIDTPVRLNHALGEGEHCIVEMCDLLLHPLGRSSEGLDAPGQYLDVTGEDLKVPPLRFKVRRGSRGYLLEASKPLIMKRLIHEQRLYCLLDIHTSTVAGKIKACQHVWPARRACRRRARG